MAKKMNVRKAVRSNKATNAPGVTMALALASLALGFIGCGNPSSDPTAQYGDLNAVAAPHNEQARSQAVLERSYLIEPEKDVTFIEGESASFKVRVRMFFAVDSYELKLVGVPSDITGVSMVKDPSEAGTFLVSWAPAKGVIPTDRQERQIKYRLELSNVRSADSSVEALFRSINKVQDFSFAVRRTGKTPEIVAVNQFPSEVAQGAIVPFTVDVQDPASFDGYAPRLDVYFQGTNRTESGFEANGATYVRVDTTPKHLGQGIWRFSFVFDAKNNDVGAQLDREGRRVEGATHLQTRMLMKAYSASGGVSGEKLVLSKIKYVAPQTASATPVVCEAPAPKPAVKAAPKAAPKAAVKPATKPAATTNPKESAASKVEVKS